MKPPKDPEAKIDVDHSHIEPSSQSNIDHDSDWQEKGAESSTHSLEGDSKLEGLRTAAVLRMDNCVYSERLSFSNILIMSTLYHVSCW
jgi:hypothetical protein